MPNIFNGLIPLAPFVMIIAVVWLGLREKISRSRLRADLQKEVVAKFSSGQELAEFLNSESGKWFMQDKSFSKWTGKGRVITLVVAGIICIGAGIGFLFGGK